MVIYLGGGEGPKLIAIASGDTSIGFSSWIVLSDIAALRMRGRGLLSLVTVCENDRLSLVLYNHS